ncbi:MAG: PQQ-binding-like beta-propeller repeat protein [Pirellulaceae bacterium]
MLFVRCCVLVVPLFACSLLQAADWSRFRGPGGLGVAAESVPSTWSPTANLGWKTALPGPGASSPIVADGKVFVTCYSGYGLSQEDPGKIEDLVRHLVCVDLQTGEQLWQKDVPAALPEDPYSGVGVTAHGYASHTPVADDKHVYAFFGKSGVHAFDFDGNPVWQKDVGKESDPTKWGSSSSPVVHNDIVIVTASAESQSIIGLDKGTGKELWRQEAEGLDGMWGTPTLAQINKGRTDLVMCVAKELWGLDPDNGKLRWFAKATGAEHAYASVVTDGKRVFAVTGRGGGSIAVEAGGKGDVSESSTIWEGTQTGSFGSPVKHGDKLYVVSRGVMTVIDSSTGDKVEQVRLAGVQESGGRFGSLDYPSPVVIGDKLFNLNGNGQMFVFDLAGELKQVAVNRVTNDQEEFRGSPAVSDGQIILRSSKHLYCVRDKGESVKPDESVIAKTDATEPNGGEEARGGPPGGEEGGGRGGAGGGAGGGRGGAGGGPGGGRFDPMSIFNGRDANKDGKLTADELAGNPMADRIKEMDKDGDDAVSAEEFQAGMASFGGGGGRGGGGYGGGKDARPDRPQRPAMAE